MPKLRQQQIKLGNQQVRWAARLLWLIVGCAGLGSWDWSKMHGTWNELYACPGDDSVLPHCCFALHRLTVHCSLSHLGRTKTSGEK